MIWTLVHNIFLSVIAVFLANVGFPRPNFWRHPCRFHKKYTHTSDLDPSADVYFCKILHVRPVFPPFPPSLLRLCAGRPVCLGMSLCPPLHPQSSRSHFLFVVCVCMCVYTVVVVVVVVVVLGLFIILSYAIRPLGGHDRCTAAMTSPLSHNI